MSGALNNSVPIYCTKLVIRPSITDLKWDPSRKK